MTKLIVPPNQSSYSLQDGTEVLMVQLDGGAPRFRRDIIGSVDRLNVQWSVGRLEFNYLKSFYVGIAKKGAVAFLIDIINDESDLVEHTAYFVPGSFSLSSVQGHLHTVSAQLIIVPDRDEAAMEAFALVYNEYGSDLDAFAALLQATANEYLPDYLS